MASAARIKAGEAFVVIGTIDKTAKGLNSIARNFQKLGATIMKVGAQITLIGATMFAALIKPIKDASDYQEDLNIFMMAFGDAADGMMARLNALGEATNRSSKRMVRSTGIYKQVFEGIGITGDAANELSFAMTRAATDMSSFFNVAGEGREGALNRLRSALSGSSEVLDQFGINIKEMRLSKELQEMFDTTSRTASEAQKALARAKIILETQRLQKITGDAARTATQFANAWRGLTDQIYEMSVAIGSALLPYLEAMMQHVNHYVSLLRGIIKTNPRAVLTYVKLAAAVSATGIALLALGAALVGVSVLFSAAATVIGTITALVGGLIAIVGTLVTTLAGIGPALLGLTMFSHRLVQTKQNVRELTGSIVSGFSKAREAIAEFIGVLVAGVLKGQFSLTMDYLVLTTQLAIAQMEKIWIGLGATVIKTVADMMKAVGYLWEHTPFLRLLDKDLEAFEQRFNTLYQDVRDSENKMAGLEGTIAELRRDRDEAKTAVEEAPDTGFWFWFFNPLNKRMISDMISLGALMGGIPLIGSDSLRDYLDFDEIAKDYKEKVVDASVWADPRAMRWQRFLSSPAKGAASVPQALQQGTMAAAQKTNELNRQQTEMMANLLAEQEETTKNLIKIVDYFSQWTVVSVGAG